MGVDDPLDETEAEAGALWRGRARAIGAEKPIENLRGHGGFHAGAIVTHLQRSAAAGLDDADDDDAARPGEFQGVVDEVEHETLQPPGVAVHRDTRTRLAPKI